MKKEILFLIICVLLCNSGILAQTDYHKKLIGLWYGYENGDTGKIEIVDSIHINLTLPGGKKDGYIYAVDFSKTPAWFDIIKYNYGNPDTLKGAVQFLNDTTCNWYVSDGTTHPINNSGNPMLLRKQK